MAARFVHVAGGDGVPGWWRGGRALVEEAQAPGFVQGAGWGPCPARSILACCISALPATGGSA